MKASLKFRKKILMLLGLKSYDSISVVEMGPSRFLKVVVSIQNAETGKQQFQEFYLSLNKVKSKIFKLTYGSEAQSKGSVKIFKNKFLHVARWNPLHYPELNSLSVEELGPFSVHKVLLNASNKEDFFNIKKYTKDYLFNLCSLAIDSNLAPLTDTLEEMLSRAYSLQEVFAEKEENYDENFKASLGNLMQALTQRDHLFFKDRSSL